MQQNSTSQNPISFKRYLSHELLHSSFPSFFPSPSDFSVSRPDPDTFFLTLSTATPMFHYRHQRHSPQQFHVLSNFHQQTLSHRLLPPKLYTTCSPLHIASYYTSRWWVHAMRVSSLSLNEFQFSERFEHT